MDEQQQQQPPVVLEANDRRKVVDAHRLPPLMATSTRLVSTKVISNSQPSSNMVDEDRANKAPAPGLRLLLPARLSPSRETSPSKRQASGPSFEQSKPTAGGGEERPSRLNIFTTRPSSSSSSRVSSLVANATVDSSRFSVPHGSDHRDPRAIDLKSKPAPVAKSASEPVLDDCSTMYRREATTSLDYPQHTAATPIVDRSPAPVGDQDKPPMEIIVKPEGHRVPSVEIPRPVEIPLDTSHVEDELKSQLGSKTAFGNGSSASVFKSAEMAADKSAENPGENGEVKESRTKRHDRSIREQAHSVYFNDGQRRIDFVLVYVAGHQKSTNVDASTKAGRMIEKEKQRFYFEENLRKDGLELEEDAHVHEGTHAETTTFVKVHAPWTVLCRQAEILKLKQPTRLNDPYADAPLHDGQTGFLRKLKALKVKTAGRLGFGGDTGATDGLPNAAGLESAAPYPNSEHTRITWPFSRKHIELFAIDDKRTFFWPSRRHEMVWEVLQNAHSDPDDEKKRGLESLLERGIYESAFPLHDGPYECPSDIQPGHRDKELCERQILKQTWADWRCVFDDQPLGLIRKYYGEKVGFYFAFLGFYVKMLIFPSITGAITFLYGMLYTGDDVILSDICDRNSTPGTYTMCPLCQPPYCPFTRLYEACRNATWDYRLDNEATVAMAVLTVVWATVMLKLWKRRQAELAFEWDTYDVKVEDSVVRPEFEERAPVKRRNPVTREMEPYVPKSTKLLWLSASTAVTLLMLCLVGAALAALVIARVSLYKTFHYLGFHDNVELSRWAVHGLIFVVVVIFEKTYSILAHKLTSLECPRTQQEWLSSYLWKVFIFALLNDFVPIGYAAWVKGRLTNTPLELNWHSELCDSGGCMSEVTELIAVLLLCRLVIGNIMEIGFPVVQNAMNRFNEQFKVQVVLSSCCKNVFKKKPPKPTGTDGGVSGPKKKKSKRVLDRHHNAQWHRDFHLAELEEDAVSPEYLEMIVQFAFVTLFIPALPLAPLVCLMNNIIEIRIDSVKFITSHRRPLPVRAPGSTIWNDFLNVICKLAVVCNAGLISFTSNVLPRLYYKFAKSENHSYDGFVQQSLSQLHHSHFKGEEERERAFFENNVTFCFYEDYRDPEFPFSRREMWWEIYCIRLAAFAIFLVLSFTFQWLFNFVVSDVPSSVNLKILRRRYVVTKAMEAMAGADAFKHRRAQARAEKSDVSRIASLNVHGGTVDANGITTAAGGPPGGNTDIGDGNQRPEQQQREPSARRRKGGGARQELSSVSAISSITGYGGGGGEERRVEDGSA